MSFEAVRADAGLARDVDRFALALIEAGHQAAAARRLEPRRYALGPFALTVRTAGEVLEQRFARALRHALVQAPPGDGGQPLDIVALDSAAAGLPPTPEWRFPLVERSHLERLHVAADGSVVLGYTIDNRIWQACARDGRAVYWCDDQAILPAWEDGSPFRSLVHWASLEAPVGIMHAAAVTSGGRGALLAGAGGSGKSTLTAALVLAGVDSAGDDLVLVDPDADGRPRAFALYDTLKLDRGSLARLPALAGPAADAPWVDQEKARLHICELAPERLKASFALHAILLPRIGSGETAITPATPADAVRAIAPTTMFLLRGGAKQTYARSVALSRRIPAFHLAVGDDPQQAAGMIKDWLEALPA